MGQTHVEEYACNKNNEKQIQWVHRSRNAVWIRSDHSNKLGVKRQHIPEIRAIGAKNNLEAKRKDKVKYDRNVRVEEFMVGDEVLKHVDKVKSKFEPWWEGPYIIVHKAKNGAYLIQDSSGNRDLINGDRLKRYKNSGKDEFQVESKKLRSGLQNLRENREN
ncbi:hypothetical protein BB559_005956 [Furculomyces boomerangus]|uniref:Uncharacterized protein n=1 Tax=Furculomyces boomerangus TaxID=61424 RepID=A0A2T9Y5M3_9FUNG|nr:hypothetical protein BB559_005956 [Furculomyces boomerangus]